MREPRLFNMRGDYPPEAIYIGRPSKWGNPFSHLPGTAEQVSTREEAISKYEEWLLSQPELVEEAKRELAGRDLVCWCAPQRCHGEVLMKIVNEETLF